MHHYPPSPDLLRLATSALDVHHYTSRPEQDPASRAELDAIHAHACALYALLDSHTATTRPQVQAEGDQLHAARIRLWQATEHLHAAYHAAPREDGRLPTREACAARLAEGAPDLTVCQRHVATSVRVRRTTTPTDLRADFTGLVRH